MKFKEQIIERKKEVQIVPEEKRIQETIKRSIDTFCSKEQEKRLKYGEFLWIQLRLIRKRWWFFQFLLLLCLWMILPELQEVQYIQKSMGVTATVFVILIIPELWKSQTYGFMEIEATSYYSLRQIYATRMMLFGIVDILLITFFCEISSITVNITLLELMIQFVFPMVVTTCICFGILCSRYPFSEMTAVIMCLMWSAIWLLIILNDKIYAMITMPLWIIFLGVAVLFLFYTVYRILYACNNYWEVNRSGVKAG